MAMQLLPYLNYEFAVDIQINNNAVELHIDHINQNCPCICSHLGHAYDTTKRAHTEHIKVNIRLIQLIRIGLLDLYCSVFLKSSTITS